MNAGAAKHTLASIWTWLAGYGLTLSKLPHTKLAENGRIQADWISRTRQEYKSAERRAKGRQEGAELEPDTGFHSDAMKIFKYTSYK